MKNALLLMFTLNLFFLFSLSAQSVNPDLSPSGKHVKFDPKRDADRDIRDAIKLARKDHKRVLLDVGGEWCIWCRRLDSLFFQNKDLEEYLNKHYIVVKINVSEENRNKKVLARYPKVAGYPHIFVLDKNGKLLHSQNTEELEYSIEHSVKGHDKVKVFGFLKRWAE